MIPVIAILAFLLFGAGDGLSTYLCMEKLGAQHEINPLFSLLGGSYGPSLFLGFKIAIVATVLLFVYRHMQKYPLYQKAVYLGMVLGGATITISNLITYLNMHTEIWMVQAAYIMAVLPCMIITGYYAISNFYKKQGDAPHEDI